jgi:DNA-directed RNA polymerase specialized sigma24 family protein
MTSAAAHRSDPATALVDRPRIGVRLSLASVGWERPLLIRIHAGDREALEELYEAFGRLVYDSAHRITHESLAAELITAGVFTRLWRCPHEFPADRLPHSLTQLADRRAIRWINE